MKKYQLLLLIFVFYYTQTYKCGIICAKCNKMQLFDPVKFKGPDLYNYHRVRAERGIKASGFNINSELVEKSRVPRGVAESKHLRLGDAHQIANYFLTGGPLKGHAHFTRSSDCNSNITEANIVGMSNPESENNTNSSVNEENPSTNVSDPITGAVHIPALPVHRPILPVQPPHLYKPPVLHPPLHPPLHALPLIPHIPHHSFLGSILHPRFHPHISTLHNIPSALVKAASMPVHGLLQAQSHLHDILKPQGLIRGSTLLGSTNKMSKRAKIRKNSGNNLMYLMGQNSPIVAASLNGSNHEMHQSNTPLSHPTHLQPTGYIVQYVPHNKESEPSSPTVGATQQESADNVDNSDTGKNETVSVNDKM